QIVETLDAAGGIFGPRQGGEKKRRKNRDDRNDHQQLDRGERGRSSQDNLHGASPAFFQSLPIFFMMMAPEPSRSASGEGGALTSIRTSSSDITCLRVIL